jgi:biopolymer transport protein ExbB
MMRYRWVAVIVSMALAAAALAAAAPAPSTSTAPDPTETVSAPRTDDPAAAANAAPAEVAAPAPVARASRPVSLYQLLGMGGPIMYPLYLCSIIAAAYAIERAVSLRRRRILPQEFVENIRLMADERPLDRKKILMYCAAEPSPVSRVVSAAVKRVGRPASEIEKSVEDAGAREVRAMRRNCRVLSGVATIAPLLGLLGTVVGMIRCFMELGGADGLGRSERMASGIYQALVTTGSGLVIAIPAAVAYLVYTMCIERLTADLEDVAATVVDAAAAPADEIDEDDDLL